MPSHPIGLRVDRTGCSFPSTCYAEARSWLVADSNRCWSCGGGFTDGHELSAGLKWSVGNNVCSFSVMKRSFCDRIQDGETRNEDVESGEGKNDIVGMAGPGPLHVLTFHPQAGEPCFESRSPQ